MTETTDIIKALKWWNADRFKSLQRKLTTAKSTIQKEALSAHFRPFLSNEEIQTLQEASHILGAVKGKIEHAKEIKAREEKARNLRLAGYKRQRQALLAEAFPKPETAEDARPILVWILALTLHHERISRGYFYERKYIASDIERTFDRKNVTTVLASAVSWWREITEFLEENMWHYDEAPDPSRIDVIKSHFDKSWRDEVSSNSGTEPLLERFDTEMAIAQSESVHRL